MTTPRGASGAYLSARVRPFRARKLRFWQQQAPAERVRVIQIRDAERRLVIYANRTSLPRGTHFRGSRVST